MLYIIIAENLQVENFHLEMQVVHTNNKDREAK